MVPTLTSSLVGFVPGKDRSFALYGWMIASSYGSHDGWDNCSFRSCNMMAFFENYNILLEFQYISCGSVVALSVSVLHR